MFTCLFDLTANQVQLATRLAILYCGQLSSSAFTGLITAGIFAGLDGTKGLYGWQW